MPAEVRPYQPLAELYAHAGRTERARAMLADMEASLPPGMRRQRDAAARVIRAELALAEHQPDEALRLLRGREPGDCRTCELPALARAFELAGRRDSAVATLERYLATPEVYRLTSDPVFLADAYRRLGTLHEALGRPRDARRAYGRFVALWRDADPELQPQADEVRRRIARLSADHPARQAVTR